jgi:hypothetical protein
MTMSTTASAPHYLEDLSIGQRFVSASHTLDHAQIIAFVLQRNGRIREGSPARTPGQKRPYAMLLSSENIECGSHVYPRQFQRKST